MAKRKLKVVGLNRTRYTFPGYRDYQAGLQRLVDLLQFVAHNDGLNGREVAKKAHVANSTLYRLFSGKTRFPRTDTVWRMCQAMGLPDAVFHVHVNPQKNRRKRA